jgi:hypothetical protein
MVVTEKYCAYIYGSARVISLAAVVRYGCAMISRQRQPSFSLRSIVYVWPIGLQRCIPATLINCPCCSSFTAKTVVAIAVKFDE